MIAVDRTDGRVVSCLLLRGWTKHAVVWYVDETIEGVEEFVDLEAAQSRVHELRAALLKTYRRRKLNP